MSDDSNSNEYLNLALSITGIVVGAFVMIASLIIHIYLCTKRSRHEIQNFMSAILILMHLTNGLGVAVYASST